MIDEKWEEEEEEVIANKTRTFKVYINVTAEISNTNFGLGQLFPTTK